MTQFEPGHQVLQLEAAGATWLVTFGNVEDGIVGVMARPRIAPIPPHPNVYWDTKRRLVDEAPDALPLSVRTAIHRWMKEQY